MGSSRNAALLVFLPFLLTAEGWVPQKLPATKSRLVSLRPRTPQALQVEAGVPKNGQISLEPPLQKKEAKTPTMLQLLIFTLAGMPIFVSPTLLSLIDTAAVGRTSSVGLAALGPGCAICDSLSGLMVFVSIGTTNAVASAMGRDDAKQARRSASVAQSLSFFIGLLLAAGLLLGTGPLLNQFTAGVGGDTAMWSQAADYVRIRGLSMPAAIVTMAAQAACLGAKDSKSPTLAVLIASVVNIIGDYWLVVRLGMGTAGAAWATVVCQYVAAACLLRTLYLKGLLSVRQLLRLPSVQDIKRFFAFGPFIFVVLMKLLTYNSAVSVAVSLGPLATAAHQVTSRPLISSFPNHYTTISRVLCLTLLSSRPCTGHVQPLAPLLHAR